MTREQRYACGRLRKQGFKPTVRGPYIHVDCTQCVPNVINGLACHETGCPPNQRKAQDDD